MLIILIWILILCTFALIFLIYQIVWIKTRILLLPYLSHLIPRHIYGNNIDLYHLSNIINFHLFLLYADTFQTNWPFQERLLLAFENLYIIL
jgi:hypothetical protein